MTSLKSGVKLGLMKKLLGILVLGLMLGSNAFAATVEDFKCTPKKTEQKEQAKKDINFRLISTKNEKAKFLTYDLENIISFVMLESKSVLKQFKNYKSMHKWFTYEFDDYLPETYSVTQYVMTENKKNGDLVLAATIIDTSQYYYDTFLNLDKLKNEHQKNEEKFFVMTLELAAQIQEHMMGRWCSTDATKQERKIAWNCNKK